MRKMLAYPFVHINGQWCRWKGVPPYDERLSKYALHAKPVSQEEETYQEMCDGRKASAIFQVPMADDGTQQWYLESRFTRAAFRSHLPPQWLIEAGTCRRLATRDSSDLDLSDMSDLDPHFLLANTIDAYAKAAATEYLFVPGFDRATFQCQDSMLAGVAADFIKDVGDIHIRLRSLAEDDTVSTPQKRRYYATCWRSEACLDRLGPARLQITCIPMKEIIGHLAHTDQRY
jgi:hypothetical protein